MTYEKKRALHCLGTLTIALLLSACAALTPRSFDQSLHLGYSTQTAVLQTTQLALSRKQISKADAAGVLEISDEAEYFLDRAKDLRNTDVSSAELSLDLATRVLDELSEYLANRGVK